MSRCRDGEDTATLVAVSQQMSLDWGHTYTNSHHYTCVPSAVNLISNGCPMDRRCYTHTHTVHAVTLLGLTFNWAAQLPHSIDARLVELTQHSNLHHTSSAPQFIPLAKCRCNTALAGDLRLCITSH